MPQFLAILLQNVLVSQKFEAQSVGHKVWGASMGVQSVGCKVWGAKYGGAKYGDAKCGHKV